MIRPRMEFGELRELAADLKMSIPELQKGISAAVSIAAIQATAAAKTTATLFTGENVGGIRPLPLEMRPSARGISVRQVIQTSAPHAPAREFGREAGATNPPYEPIRRWVELLHGRGRIDLSWVHGDTDEERISVAAMKLVFAIGRRGFPGEGFMEKGAEVGAATLSDELWNMIASWQTKLERGGF